MKNLLSQLENSAENSPIHEWPRTRPSPDDEVWITTKVNKRDPLGDLEFSDLSVACVAGFATSCDPPSLVYFWGQDLGLVSYANLPRQKDIPALVRFAMMLRPIGGSVPPTLPDVRSGFAAELSRLFDEGPDYLDGKHLYWIRYDDLLFVSLYSLRGSAALSTTSILDFTGFHSDYFRLKSPVWNSIPMSFLFDRVQKSPDLVARLLLEPKCFNPFETAPRGWFLWPWQRSLALSADGESVRYSPIETTSLVFDLRKSTMALEQLRDEDVGLFSRFIKNVVSAAKRAVFDEGGFFDKETGDGIVAHFWNFSLPEAEIEPADVRAFRAARTLIEAMHDLCRSFQEQLNMGVGTLGASVGLHSGKAVWTCEKNLVSAYGESVILASRLCAEARTGSIFASNRLFQNLASSLPPDEISRFDRKVYRGKEYSQGSQLFGHLMQVAPASAVSPSGRRDR